MKVIKKKMQKTYKGKDGKEHNSYSYYIQADNGKRICISVFNANDRAKLDMIAEYEG